MINNRVLTLKLFLMRKILLTFVLNLFAIIATASVQYNGLNYELNGSKNTATVLKSESAENLIIPETIIIEGKEYIVTDIDNNAFQGCSQLVSVSIPKTIKSIGARAFQTGKVVDIYIKDLSAWCNITHKYLHHTTGGQYIYEPIADYRLFLNGSEVTSLEIPSEITYLKTNCFSGCKSISTVVMHDKLNYIGDYAFYKCDGLSTIEFSDNVTNIGEYCFCDCRLLENIKLPRFLETLKIGALLNTNISEITIPGSVTEIGSGCFLNCNNLKTVKFEDSDLDLTLGYGQYNRQPLFIGNPIQRLYLGRNLKEKTMISNIGYSISPFMNQTGLTNVTIGNNVKIIGPYLFSGCSSLSEINTPNSLEQIGNGAFEGCTNLPIIDNIQYAGKCAVRVVDKDLDSYNLSNDTKFILSACFSGCVNLKKIDLPNSIIYWGDYVFEGCTKLKEITIPDKVETIAKKMFSGCEELENISIPSNIKIINSDAFSGCKSLKEIVIPRNVVRIEDNAFYGCYSLKEVVLEDCSNSIGMGTSGYDKKSLFYDCPLEKVYIGRNMASSYWVGNRNDYLPFYGKETIKELTIGSDVTNLWAYSFYGCNAIEDITVKHDIPIMLENYTFSSELYSKCRLNVPVNSVSLYSSANIWSNFEKIIGVTTGIQKVILPSDNIDTKYNLNGTISNDNNGIKIIKCKNGQYKKIIKHM